MDSVQTVILKQLIPSDGIRSGVLEVRLFSHSGLTDSAQATVRAVNQAQSRDDPGVFLVTSGASNVASVTINNTLATPMLLLGPLAQPIGAMLCVKLDWSQGSDAPSGVEKIVIGVDLVGRAGV
ncbi:MAG TPA: hypothetical protein VFB62_28005 [Polyangiaceae bacterium]|nr:hypothetical protein [Polyangiaceae bacterium]